MVKRDLFKQIILMIIFVLALVGLRIWVFEPVTINEQMANQYLEEDEVILAVKGSEMAYGDFVLYTVDETTYVGRLIASGGDTVTYMDDVLYRNDEIVHETYLSGSDQSEYYTDDLTIATLTNGEYTEIPDGNYLILNDNRSNKQDSREFGLIPQENIVGRLSFRVLPFKKFGFIQTGLTQ